MKEPYDFHNPNLLGVAEQIKRLRPLRQAMEQADLRAALVSSPVSIYYLTGRIYRGYLYITVDNDAPLYLVRRPTILHGPGVHLIAKPSQINETLAKAGMAVGEPVALELDTMPYHDAMRLAQALGMEAPEGNISPLLRACRAVKTEREKDMLRRSGVKHAEVYSRIPGLYKTGMTDIELQIEIERASRLEGCLGIFRCAGPEMEIFMGNVLTGDNADAPSPYDFAMGGAGLDSSLPVGADGTVIRPGLPVMVDVNGNYTGYMTDMTRCFAAGTVSPEVEKANRLSADICAGLAGMMAPGTAAADLYNRALEMAREAGMEEYFMGHRSHAGFVGHGVGIEINELPVIAPRSRDILAAGNAIALEPKFVLPGIGAVGVENTYLVGSSAPGELITKAPQNIVALD